MAMAMQRAMGEGQLTLVGALGGDVAVVVDLDLRAVPGDVEVSLDDHVCGGWGKETFVRGCSKSGC